MSVQVNTYVIYGTLLPYSACEDHYDALEPYMDDGGKDGVSVLYDGMNGQYVAVGHVLAKSEDDQGFEEPIHTFEAEKKVGDYRKAAMKLLDEIGVVPSLSGFQWLVISHYR